jgi:signal transduction histidine kinase
MSAALQASREQLVMTREEERRRIRRDLHDGLGPTLASLRMQLSAARRLVRDNPDEAEQLIDELRDDVSTATADIRRLVYALRPPMLDELGLVVAISNFKLGDSPTRLEVIAPEPMPRLSAAVEVAVYRIASEAIHNVVKHARATTCVVELQVETGQLTLRVTDDGYSLPAGHTTGIGLHSMQERAAELGGTFSIQPAKAGGTCIVVHLPLEAE